MVSRGAKKKIAGYSGVVAVGVGLKVRGGEKTNQTALVVSVKEKLPREAVKKKELIPESVEGLVTDVIESDVIKIQQIDPTKRHRPIMPGISIGHPAITAGTFGCVIEKDNSNFILSNNHVMANSNDAVKGDPILQPGIHDGGVLVEDRVASLYSFVPIKFTELPIECPITEFLQWGLNWLAKTLGSRHRFTAYMQNDNANLVDAALAKIEVPFEAIIPEIGEVAGFGVTGLDSEVKKFGRTTGFTTSKVQQVEATVNVQYGEGRIVTFEDQFIAGAMSAGGDSGSAVLNPDNEIVGLLFAGSDTLTIFNDIKHVRKLLNF